jgi:hypothetical protein
MRWTGHVARIEAMRNAYKILTGKSESKRLLKVHRNRWENNIKMEFREMTFQDVDGIWSSGELLRT